MNNYVPLLDCQTSKTKGELEALKNEIVETERKIYQVQLKIAQTKWFCDSLTSSTGEDVIEACSQIFSMLGWKVSTCPDDRNELTLHSEDNLVSLVRLIPSAARAERYQLSQLSISQTRMWSSLGYEPKGILVLNIQEGKTSEDLAEVDFSDYAKKRNICLISTIQMLALYKEVALKGTNRETLRLCLKDTRGFLKGYDLESGGTQAHESKLDFSPTMSK